MCKLFYYLRLILHLNLIKTLYFNFKVFPLIIAIKVPVYFFGSVKFASLSGKIILSSSKLYSGMIVFGSRTENIMLTKDPTRLFVTGTLVFEGKCVFMQAAQIVVWDNGILKIGENASFGTSTKIVSFKSIIIKNNLLSSWECQFFDTDFHFLMNTINHEIYNNCKSVIIGENCWIGNRTTILKGTILPENCIVGGNSLCNKDYTLIVKKSSIIAGSPAKLIKDNITFINNKDVENKLNRVFWNLENENSSIILENLNI